MRLRFLAVALAAAALASCDANKSITPVDAPATSRVAALAAPDRYIVVYKAAVTSTQSEISRHVTAQEVRVDRIYDHALHGWAGAVTAAELERLKNDPHVAYVERDAVVTIWGTTSQTPTPSWGLDRIDQGSLPLNQTYTYSQTGAGVHFYGIDTGILYSHSDFGGRASLGIDEVTPGGNGVDCAGHGTHTASTAAGATYGVAKAMTVVGVRVLDCSGSGFISDVIAGVDWVTSHAVKPAVANMSLGGGLSPTLDAAITSSIASGVVYAIAGGNSNVDACTGSPADTPNAITVGATDASDNRASFSNFGPCTDIFAPGVNITAAWIGSNVATNVISGTSMATPHVAGVVGLYLEANPTATPAQVATALVNNATSGKVIAPGTGSPNKLLYMGFLNAAPPVNLPPTDAITAPANNSSAVQGSNVTFTGNGSDPEDGPLTGGSLVWTSNINGQIGTGTSFSTTALSVGTHTITLTAKDHQGLPAIASVTLTITSAGGGNQAPVASFTINCPTTQCTVDGSGSTDDVGIVKYTWNWGNGKSESHTTPTSKNTWNPAGTYTISLTVTDGGGLTNTTSKTVSIPNGGTPNQSPTAAITAPANPSSFVQGASVSFAGTGSDPEDGALTGAALVWSSSRDGQIGTGTSFSTTTLSIGTHTITLTAKDHLGAPGVASISVTVTAPVNQSPTAAITAPANPSSFVQGASVSFAGSANDPEDGALTGAALVWSSNRDGQIGTGASFSTTILSVGTHTITLTAKDHLGAPGTAAITVTITAPVNQQPTAAITAPANPSTFVQGASVSFAGSGNDPEDGALSGASLVWTSSRDGQIGTGASFSTTSLSVGTHTITLSAKDHLGATGTATTSVTITASGGGNQPPVARFTWACPTHQCTLDASTSTDDVGIVSYAWNWGNGRSEAHPANTAKNTWPVSGTYTVTLTVTDGGGLTSVVSHVITVP